MRCLFAVIILAVCGFSTVAQAQIGPTDPPCSASGSTVTCNGTVTPADLGQGLSLIDTPYDTLNIGNLTGSAISPSKPRLSPRPARWR